MAVLVRAEIDRWSGFARLRFPFDRATIERIKDVPGARWDPNIKAWWISLHGWEVLKSAGIKGSETEVSFGIVDTTAASVPEQIAQRLRPYQMEASTFLLRNAGALLTMEMRTGKTPSAIGAITAVMGKGLAEAAFIAYPASIRETWRSQLRDWAGLELVDLASFEALAAEEIAAIRAKPWLVLGCHFEILSQREEDVHKILAGKSYVALADELHHCKNRKAPRTKALRRIGSAWGSSTISNATFLEEDDNAHQVAAGYCVARWGLTGTPMRNRNKDLFCLFDWIHPGGMGGYWTFCKRYCNPPEAPIWMGDFSFKPLGEVKVGDEVIGWERRTEPKRPGTDAKATLRQTLTRATVTNVSRRSAPIVKITMESGRVIRCTEDHHWLAANNYAQKIDESDRAVEVRRLRSAGVPLAEIGAAFGLSMQSVWRIVHPEKTFEYLPAKVGRNLVFVVDPSPDPVRAGMSVAQAHLAGWVAGMYDGEGHGAFISQSSEANPETLERLSLALTDLGIEHEVHEDREVHPGLYATRATTCGGIYITGGREGFMRFLKIVQPTRQNNGWDRTLLTGRFRTKDKVVSIEPDGEGEVIGLTTTTGNYVVWGYASKNCDAHINDRGHWEDKGNSNDEELNRRLAAISFKVTRAQVAPWLPKSDRKVIMCGMPLPLMKKYRALEKAYATKISKTLDEAYGGSEEDLKQLALATVGAKIPTAVDRAYDHAARGVKVICFANYHETLQRLEESFDAFVEAEKAAQADGISLLPPHFCAGGWMTPAKRHAVIEQWRACPGPSILLVNTISSGVGIDLADAEAAIFVELTWVPADYRQAEDRIQDVHKGKRTTPPLYEMLVVRDTIDEVMAAKLLEKIRNIENVVGADQESANLAGALRGAGVVGNDRLGLPNTSHETIMAAIASIRDRWLSDEKEELTEGEKLRDKLLAAASSLEDDEPNSPEEAAGLETL